MIQAGSFNESRPRSQPIFVNQILWNPHHSVTLLACRQVRVVCRRTHRDERYENKHKRVVYLGTRCTSKRGKVRVRRSAVISLRLVSIVVAGLNFPSAIRTSFRIRTGLGGALLLFRFPFLSFFFFFLKSFSVYNGSFTFCYARSRPFFFFLLLQEAMLAST